MMKKTALMILVSILFLSCEKENNDNLIGKWRLVKGYDLMAGGYYDIPDKDQRFEEYTKDNVRIQSDLNENEISRCNYSATNTSVTISGKDNDGDEWSFTYQYWFQHDTLAIKHDGGWEYYNEYFIRVR
ncbi:MAG: hypothetical protein ACOXZV_04390 [Bacteroidales bacterium]|jgi:hypothetical protein